MCHNIIYYYNYNYSEATVWTHTHTNDKITATTLLQVARISELINQNS